MRVENVFEKIFSYAFLYNQFLHSKWHIEWFILIENKQNEVYETYHIFPFEQITYDTFLKMSIQSFKISAGFILFKNELFYFIDL